jgi:hypothetical protein
VQDLQLEVLALLRPQIIMMMSEAGLRRAWLIKVDPHTGMGMEEKIATKDESYKQQNACPFLHNLASNCRILRWEFAQWCVPHYSIFFGKCKTWCIWKQILFIWKQTNKHVFYLLTH